MIKILIVGAGGVGGYLGGKLALSNKVDVKLLARGEHKRAIKEDGLTIIEDGESKKVKIDLFDRDSKEIFDVVFIATKSYDLKLACDDIKDNIDKDTLLIPLLNGVDHKYRLKEYLKRGIFCDGCIYIISHKVRAGVIEKKGKNFYMVFGCEGNNSIEEELKEILNSLGLKTKFSKNSRYDCWKKYLFISAFATLTSYYDLGMREVSESYPEILNDILYEIKEVANGLKVDISDDDIKNVYKQVNNLPKNSKTSMQLDLESGKTSEIDSLVGYIVKKGEELNIDIKNIKRLYKELIDRHNL